jgi:DNA-binding MarR family transcriptional regulator
MARPVNKRNLSTLQKSILQWLYTNKQHRREAEETPPVPYTDIVQAVPADKAGVTLALRQLMRQGLLLITLPRGGRTRAVALTDDGKAFVKALTADERKRGVKGYVDDFTRLVWEEKRQRHAAKRRDRNRPPHRKRPARRLRYDDEPY